MRVIRSLVWALLALLCLTGGAAATEHGGYILRLEPRMSLFSLRQELPEGMEELCGAQNLFKTADEALIAELEEAGLLAYAEPDGPAYLLELPDDPALADGSQWNLPLVGMEPIWARETPVDGAGVRVGIIDSGVYAEHEDLTDAHVLQGVNLLAEEGTEERRNTSDAVGHGTFIAGIIAAATDNGLGMAGIAPGAEILPLKSFDASTGSVSDVVAAIYAGVDAGCHVLNMSFGVEERYAGQALKEAVAYAAERGVILVAAVGNSGRAGTEGDPLFYPAAYDEVIGVGAVNRKKKISSFSHKNESVTAVAPGESLFSLGTSAPDAYRTGKGTSFSAPMVTAAAALALSVDSDLTAAEFGALLRASAEDLGEPGCDPVYGCGLLNVAVLLDLLENGCHAMESGEGRTAVIWAQNLTPNSSVRAVRVICDESGVQTAFLLTEFTVGEDGTLRGEVPLPEGGRVSLMLLDENWRPAMNRWSSGGEAPPEPPEEELPPEPLPELPTETE